MQRNESFKGFSVRWGENTQQKNKKHLLRNNYVYYLCPTALIPSLCERIGADIKENPPRSEDP